MPPARCDFCAGGHAWAAALMHSGSPPHFLCHYDWRGDCTHPAGEHTPLCSSHFHNHEFVLPVSQHADALAVFFSQNRDDQSRELHDYADAAYDRCPLELIELGTRFMQLRPHIRAVCRMNTGAAVQAPSVRMLRAMVESDAVLCRGMLHDVVYTGITADAIAVQAYRRWLCERGTISRSSWPELAAAVDAVLAKLPFDLRGAVNARLFHAG